MLEWADSRTGVAGSTRKYVDKVFPNHWSFLLGEVTLYSFVILVATGTWLAFFFDPSTAETTYEGSYAPLHGVEMTKAYASALELSFDVRAGLVMRQMHHWAALLFMAAMTAHLARTFFTGAFRKPRELNWIIGVVLLILGIVNGFAGYSLLDDQLSGTGLRIAYSVALSIPIAGTWMASLFFGGDFPGDEIINRLFVIHVYVVPIVIAVLLGAHLALVVAHKHTHFRGDGATEDNVVGERLWPTYAAKAGGLFFLTAAVIALLGGIAQINPVWVYGPFRAANVSTLSQPDWYMGWLEGAMRLMPGWEIRAFGFEVPNPFFPGVLIPGITFGALLAWPFLEARFGKDHEEHHVLDRPRDRPLRTALGMATFAFYTVLGMGGASDALAQLFDVSVNNVIRILRVLLFVLPVVAAYVTRRLCLELQARDRIEEPELERDLVDA
ncbi:MAG TPA: ubiquinol-cytochrome c reductase cytochrome b subunit [Acidimicrobiales bacterium]|nr:ubiquinol-cytochrome c reductase cytochrome b subunit [Acidimicrobiales bacterium]